MYGVLMRDYPSQEAVVKTRPVFEKFAKSLTLLYGSERMTAYHHVICCHAYAQLRFLLSLKRYCLQSILFSCNSPLILTVLFLLRHLFYPGCILMFSNLLSQAWNAIGEFSKALPTTSPLSEVDGLISIGWLKSFEPFGLSTLFVYCHPQNTKSSLLSILTLLPARHTSTGRRAS